MTDDELDDLLTPKVAPANPQWLDAVRLRSQPRRPWAFRRWIAALLFVTIGFTAGWYLKPAPPPQTIIETVIERVPVPEPISQPEVLAALTADQLEVEAERTTDRDQSARLFRQAGDEYLKSNAIESAMRCYRQHLDELGPEGLAVRNEDSWLLSSIKNSRPQGD